MQGCSDSSMDDCNEAEICRNSNFSSVQIPLWTIVTLLREMFLELVDGSDSSMDDCNAE